MTAKTVTGKRSDGSLIVDKGFVYNHVSWKKGNRYVKCSASICSATGVVRVNENHVSVLRHHCHAPNKTDEELALYRDSIRREASDPVQSCGFRNIFDRQSARFPSGSLLRTFPQDQQIMRRIRDNNVPPVPKDLDHLHDILNFQPIWRNHALAHNSHKEFFRETVLASDGSRVSVLVCPYMSPLLTTEGVALAADATFAVRPLLPTSEQLLALHAFESIDGKSYSWPCAYALMERKSQSAYVAAFTAISEAVEGRVQPGSLLADFEKQMHNAGDEVWPGLRTSGCWFHYCNAVHGQACSLHLVDICAANEVADKQLLKCLALPLLPPGEILNGYAVIVEELTEFGLYPSFRPFMKYIETEWLDERRVGVEMLSVFELGSRTNNDVETSHFQLYRKININRPNFWVFNIALKMYMYSKHQDRLRALSGLQIRRQRPTTSVIQDDHIKNMQTQLANGEITVQAFLNKACHSAEGLQKRLNKRYITIRNRQGNLQD